MQILLLLVLIQSIFSYHALTQPYGGMIFLPFFHLFLTGESQTYGSNSDILQTYSPEHKGPKIKEKKKKKKKDSLFSVYLDLEIAAIFLLLVQDHEPSQLNKYFPKHKGQVLQYTDLND